MGQASKASPESTDSNARASFLVSAVRALLVSIKQLLSLSTSPAGDDCVKSVEQLNELVGDPQRPVEQLQKALVACRHAVAGQAHAEKSQRQEREAEYRKIIAYLARNLGALAGDLQGGLTGLDSCASRLEQAKEIQEIAALRQVLAEQVDVLKSNVAQQRQQQSLAFSSMNEQLAVLTASLGRTEKEALTDPLTGAGNRRGLERALQARADRANSGDGCFAVLLWDVDNFKKLNDTYGHQVGDGVLRALAKQCYKMIRGGDYLGRYGGEEFVIVLDDVSLGLAEKRAWEVVRSVAAMEVMFGSPSSPQRLRCTISMGIADFKPGESIETLLARADKALYAAKAAGKNRCLPG